MNRSQLRNFVFTWNNYTSDDVKVVEDYIKEHCKYGVFGREVGESGTSHLQGYMELKKRTRFNTLRKALNNSHIEKRRGTAKQASDYSKKDGDFFEHGEISQQGKRNDLVAYQEAIKERKGFTELAEEFPNTHPRYYKYARELRFHYDQKEPVYAPIEVIVLWGDAGTGKTRTAYEEEPGLWTLPPATKSQSVWFDGYCGQDTILIDDFYGGCGVSYPMLLRLLHGYKFQLPVKGGFVWKRWKKVYITSNEPPESWYPNGLTPALKRRLTHIIHVTNDE